MVKSMKKVKSLDVMTSHLASELLRRLGAETVAFELTERLIPESTAGERRLCDEVITLQLKSTRRPVQLFAFTRKSLFPRTALSLFSMIETVPTDGTPLICAAYLSPRVVELCRERKINYLDGAGNSRIELPGLFIQIEGRLNPPPASKMIDPFSKKSSRIVRALLTDPDQGWQVQQLAQAASVSLGLVSKVKTPLLEEAYLEERDRLLFVRDAVKLLDRWSAVYRLQVKQRSLFALARPAITEKRLAEWCRTHELACGLTQLTGAWRYAPTVRYEKSVIYLDPKIELGSRLTSLLEHLEAREAEYGANCILWIPSDPVVFRNVQEFDGVPVVSPIQLYLDLKALPGRGEEAAQEILERQLQPRFAEATTGGDR
jgi:hypothetical protein